MKLINTEFNTSEMLGVLEALFKMSREDLTKYLLLEGIAISIDKYFKRQESIENNSKAKKVLKEIQPLLQEGFELVKEELNTKHICNNCGKCKSEDHISQLNKC